MILASPSIVLAVLLALHRPALDVGQCIDRHRHSVERVAARAQDELGVPPAVLLAVARRESHFGCRGGHSWGAPHSRRNRFGLGTPMDAARALEHSFRVCGTWERAASRFRSGHCVLPARRRGRPDRWRDHRAYVRSVVRDVEAIAAQTGTPAPERLR